WRSTRSRCVSISSCCFPGPGASRFSTVASRIWAVHERRRAVQDRATAGCLGGGGGCPVTFDWSVVWQHRGELFAATGTTILLTVATMAIAVPCGIVVAALRLYAWAPVRVTATAYVELFRNLPLILVVFWAFYVLPILIGVGLS